MQCRHLKTGRLIDSTQLLVIGQLLYDANFSSLFFHAFTEHSSSNKQGFSCEVTMIIWMFLFNFLRIYERRPKSFHWSSMVRTKISQKLCELVFSTELFYIESCQKLALKIFSKNFPEVPLISSSRHMSRPFKRDTRHQSKLLNLD